MRDARDVYDWFTSVVYGRLTNATLNYVNRFYMSYAGETLFTCATSIPFRGTVKRQSWERSWIKQFPVLTYFNLDLRPARIFFAPRMVNAIC